MADKPSLPDWITAASTAFTGAFSLGAMIIAWITLRRDSKRETPRVEPTIEWATHKTFGRYLNIEILIINRYDETMIIHDCTLTKPLKVKLSTGLLNQWGERGPAIGNSNHCDLNYRISSPGSTNYAGSGRGDLVWVILYGVPPEGWVSGWVKLTLRFSTKADTVRDRRIAIKRFVPAAKAQNNPAATSNAG